METEHEVTLKIARQFSKQLLKDSFTLPSDLTYQDRLNISIRLASTWGTATISVSSLFAEWLIEDGAETLLNNVEHASEHAYETAQYLINGTAVLVNLGRNRSFMVMLNYEAPSTE